jgi:hypothetical protein
MSTRTECQESVVFTASMIVLVANVLIFIAVMRYAKRQQIARPSDEFVPSKSVMDEARSYGWVPSSHGAKMAQGQSLAVGGASHGQGQPARAKISIRTPAGNVAATP